MIRHTALITIMAAALLTAACTRDAEVVSSGIDDYYNLPRLQKLLLATAYTGEGYRWTERRADGTDSLLGTGRSLIYLSAEEGEHHLTFTIDDGDRGYTKDFLIRVVHEQVEYSADVAHVYDYRPAPGQFVGSTPLYEKGDTEEKMRQKVEDCLATGTLVTLGAWGGYVTFGFDHTLINTPSQRDLYIEGNAFYSDIAQYGQQRGGSCEPGIVMVSLDTNMNGLPDDEWYELAGSEYHSAATLHDYAVTYRHPDSTPHTPISASGGRVTDTQYIAWTDNRGTTGYVERNIYHSQSYWPQWIADSTLTFTGARLAPNAVDASGLGNYYVLYSYPWGYVDNHPNDSTRLCSFDLDWAVDGSGQPVHLPGADFIRVYTGVNQCCGWLGETSTEISGARDLYITRGREQ